MTANRIDGNEHIDKNQQIQTERTQMQEAQTRELDRLDQSLLKDVQTAARITEEKEVQQQNNLESTRGLNSSIAANQKAGTVYGPDASQKTILTQAIKETESMVSLSKDAVRVPNQKVAADIAQLSKTDTTINTKDRSFVASFAAMSQAIEQDTRYNFRALRIAEDMAINNQNARENQSQTDINNEQIKKPDRQEDSKMDVSTGADYGDQTRESAMKALAEARLKEEQSDQNAIDEILEKPTPVQRQTNKQTMLEPKQTQQHPIQPSPQKPANKLKAKFGRSKYHL